MVNLWVIVVDLAAVDEVSFESCLVDPTLITKAMTNKAPIPSPVLTPVRHGEVKNKVK